MAKAEDIEPTQVEVAGWVESKKIPGLLHSTRGIQPNKNWDDFLNSLPTVDGEDWERFHEAIMENRKMRRELAAEQAANDEVTDHATEFG